MSSFFSALLLIALASLVAQVHSNGLNFVRLSLSKTTAKTAGDFGQPMVSYYALVAVGSPIKHFRLLVDVNARENWLPHHLKLGVIYARLNYRNGYAKKSSSTGIKEEEKEYTINYDGCELTGKAYTDIFQLRELNDYRRAVPQFKQRFLAISSASDDRFGRRGDVDGVLAINPWPLSETGSDLISVSLKRADAIKELKFGLALEDDHQLNSVLKSAGELTLGGINPYYYKGSLRYHQVFSQHAWELKLQGVMFGSVAMVSCGSQPQNCPTGLVSTSHNDIYAPSRDVHQLLSLLGYGDELKASGLKMDKLYDIDCLKVADLPPLTIIIDGSHYSVAPVSYIRKKVGKLFGNETCYVGILPNNNNENQWILGTNFLANFYTVLDVESRQVAFGTRR